jgi:hypothetical protein
MKVQSMRDFERQFQALREAVRVQCCPVGLLKLHAHRGTAQAELNNSEDAVVLCPGPMVRAS